ncbi:MAG TPA: hypothetical protein P5246_05250 [Candidatus Omnitrophota bacterium]|jgi:hypothetical protein|nr:hypothetical protein [Candidatus Omnitrophota bacterium]HSA30721.1 hypothetical protein [Candidatus Omnitrophota bacterium]
MIKASHQKLFQKSESCGLLLALAIHLIIANIFVFTVPVRPVAHKPVFVYLGSFLENIQSADPLFYASQKNQMIPDHIPIPAAKKTIYNQPPLEDGSHAPQQSPSDLQYKKTLFKKHKASLKETFLEPEHSPAQRIDKNAIKTLRINPDPPVYKPLSIQNTL